MKKIFTGISALIIMLSSGISVLAAGGADNIRVVLNGEDVLFDTAPFIENDRTLVPIRAITEAMGCDVDWDADTSTAIIQNDETVVYIQIDNEVIQVENDLNVKEVVIDVPAKLYNDRTYVPLRAVSEAFGADVDWDGDNSLVTIEYTAPEDEIIEIVDEAFEYSIRKRLGYIINDDKDSIYTEALTAKVLNQIESLTLVDTEAGIAVKSLEDISKLNNLETIKLHSDAEIEDFSPLFEYMGESVADFADKAFELCVRSEVSGKKSTIYLGSLSDDDLESVTSLSTYNLCDTIAVKSIEDIALLPNLKSLTIDVRQDIDDYSPIGTISEWEYLDLEGLNIDDDEFLDDINVTDTMTFPNLGYSNYAVDFTMTGSKYQYPQALSMYRQTLQSLEEFKTEIKDSMSDYEKFKKIHDYVCLNMEYNWEEYDSDVYGNDYEYEFYPDILSQFFVGGKGVCVDYSWIYSKLCSYFGLECWCVSGDAYGAYGWDGHAWNIVNLDGNYYHVDVTFDDLDDGDEISYEYFLVSDDTMGADHKWYTDETDTLFIYGYTDGVTTDERFVCPQNYTK